MIPVRNDQYQPQYITSTSDDESWNCIFQPKNDVIHNYHRLDFFAKNLHSKDAKSQFISIFHAYEDKSFLFPKKSTIE